MSGARTLSRNGVNLALHDAGGDGVPFLFQHGLCGSAAQTFEVMPSVAGVRPLTLECRGHGDSEPGDPAQFSFAAFHDDLAAVVADLGRPVIIGGISMGAALATRFAVAHPSAVRGLVIARPAWVTKAAPENLQPNREVGALLAKYPPEDARRVFLASDTARQLAAQAPDNLASLTGFFSREPIATTSALLTRIAGGGPGVTEAQLRAIACPVLILGTAEDLAHPFAMCEELAALIPQARLIRITPKGRDKAAYVSEFKAALAAFLKDVPDATA